MALRIAACLVVGLALVRVAAAQSPDPAPTQDPAPTPDPGPSAGQPASPDQVQPPAKKLTPKQRQAEAKRAQAEAKKAQAEAKKHVAEGTKLYNIQQYAQAADEYQAAYMLDQRPEYLYAAAQSQRLGGDCEKALTSYNNYLRTNPKQAERDKAQKNIDRCEQDIKDRQAAAAAEAAKKADEEAAAKQAADAAAAKAAADAADAKRRADEAAAKRAAEEAKAAAIKNAPPPPKKTYIAGHLMLAVGLVGIGGGVYLYRDGHSAVADHNGAPTYDQFLAGHADADKARQRQAIGVATTAGGLALVGGAVVYYVLHARAPVERTTVSASVGGGHTGIVLTRSF